MDFEGLRRFVVRVLLFPLHAWIAVTFASAFLVIFFSLGVLGLLFPDAWLDARMRAKFQELQDRGQRRRQGAPGGAALEQAPEGVTGAESAAAEAAGAETDAASGAVGALGGAADSAKEAASKPLEEEQGTNTNSDAALTYKCAWCGGRKLAGEECCGYGMVSPERIPWTVAKDFAVEGGSSSKPESKVDQAGDFAGSGFDGSGKNKPKDKGNPGQQVLALFRKFGKQQKKKPVQEESEKDDLKAAGSQANADGTAAVKTD